MEPIVVNACVCCSSRLRIDPCLILDTLESATCRTSGTQPSERQYSETGVLRRPTVTQYMVGGPGITFDTSTAVGHADAEIRFLQAFAAQDGYARTASTEVPALRAHLLRTSQATRQACSSSDGPCSNDHQLRSAAGGCEEPRSSAMVNVYDQLRQTSRVLRTVTASGTVKQPVPGSLISSTATRVETSATTGAM